MHDEGASLPVTRPPQKGSHPLSSHSEWSSLPSFRQLHPGPHLGISPGGRGSPSWLWNAPTTALFPLATSALFFTEDPVVKKFLAWDKNLEVSDKVSHPLRWIPAPAPVLRGRAGCFLHPRFHSPPNLMPCQHFPPGASRSPLGSEPQECPFGGCCLSPLSSQLLGTRLGSGSSNTVLCPRP